MVGAVEHLSPRIRDMDVMEALTRAGAVSNDRHFVYTSGRHGPTYINLDHLLPDIAVMTQISRELASPFSGMVDVVAAPAVGAIVLAVLTAQALSEDDNEVAAVWADKTAGGDFLFDRAGFAERLRGRRVLVVEDLVTTGGSVRKVCREVERHGATIVAVSAICNRGGATAEGLSVPRLHTLSVLDSVSYPPENCPLCADSREIVVDVGHGAEFRQEHPRYLGGFVRLHH